MTEGVGHHTEGVGSMESSKELDVQCEGADLDVHSHEGSAGVSVESGKETGDFPSTAENVIRTGTYVIT